jgi:predicted lipoprotein with Yx(FWY)xxD motif
MEASMSKQRITHEPSLRVHPRRVFLAPLGLAGIALAVAACGSTTASSVSVPQPAVATPKVNGGAVLGTASTPLGTILVDAQGRTLYEFASDSKNTSTCTGQCLTYWPVATAPANPPGAVPGITGSLGSFARPDGGTQLTINGLPLYTYAADTAPGMTSGQGSTGSGAKWWVVAPGGSPVTATAPAGQPAPATSSSAAAAARPTAGGY